MALLDKSKKPVSDNQLSVQELEFLLDKIRDMGFVGSELDILTRVVVKLQNQYLSQTEQN